MTAISFKPLLALAVMKGLKTQTRRGIEQGITLNNSGAIVTLANHSWTNVVYNVNMPEGKKPRAKWRVGNTMPIKASRTGKALGYVQIEEIRIQDIRDMSHADAVEERCADMYPLEPFRYDPLASFWYTWLTLNKIPVAKYRELTVPLWDGNDFLEGRRAKFIQRLRSTDLPNEYFMAYAISFTYIPHSVTLAGLSFLAEQAGT